MNSFGSMTVEACMKNYIQENKLKDDDVIKGVREKWFSLLRVIKLMILN
ncbi:hypothetical protein [Clostridium estertheticum]|nr:hypothetical protein [Clostridium estertheticum]MBU3072497.1 hypothetical protein [Clostridium estertheticum]MBU3162590.1 hypothetical protein [Clostridium estertheticum]MBU3172531.1 hypothetical protein [Clostridium estertheticum]MBZ9618228.1 hypothetical protein [Clostridium estertheticum subsp. laramiense]WAG73876.1 hypothetical protein LL032_22625 [Clostridium estertheticum]